MTLKINLSPNKENFLCYEDCKLQTAIDEEYASLQVAECFSENKQGAIEVDDGALAAVLQSLNKMVFANGAFYSPDGMMSKGEVAQGIYMTIAQHTTKDIAAKTDKTLKALRHLAFAERFDYAGKMTIPLAGGDLHIQPDGYWVYYDGQKEPTPYRLPIEFYEVADKPPTPNFDKWLHDLFAPADIQTLQEFLGYCLLPTTRAQAALLLIGEGGVGKSVLASVLSAVFGRAMTAPDDTITFLQDRFKIAELENQLVFYEDDLSDKTMEDGGKFKKLITNEAYITAERKGEHPFKFKPYCKFIICGNSMLESANDKSDGFYRRLLPIEVLPKDPNRKVIKNFGELVAGERDGIAVWMMQGLKRLMDNHWEFTVSSRTKAFLQDFRQLSDPLSTFCQDVLVVNSKGSITDSEMQDVYTVWCRQNGVRPVGSKTLKTWLFNNGDRFGLKRCSSNNIVRNGKRLRGYKGCEIHSDYVKNEVKIRF